MLKKALPPKEEHVIFIRMSPIQRQLYKAFMGSLQNESVQNMVSSNPLKAFSVGCKVSVFSMGKSSNNGISDLGSLIVPLYMDTYVFQR